MSKMDFFFISFSSKRARLNFVIVLFLFSFISCGDSDEVQSGNDFIEQVEGMYIGTFTAQNRLSSVNYELVDYSGNITITKILSGESSIDNMYAIDVICDGDDLHASIENVRIYSVGKNVRVENHYDPLYSKWYQTFGMSGGVFGEIDYSKINWIDGQINGDFELSINDMACHREQNDGWGYHFKFYKFSGNKKKKNRLYGK